MFAASRIVAPGLSDGGEAPGLSQVRAATMTANSVARATRFSSLSASRSGPRERHQARNAPAKASPAPIVSASWIDGAATRTSPR